MKKLIISIVCVCCAFGAYAENENAATSKEYVDTELATKQPTIPAQGNNVVMTFDSTANDGIGTKQVYDESASYASQTDALVTAETANAAVQMAIQGEFYCKEWSTIVENDCWLWGIKEPTPHAAGKNLFDIKKANILYNHLNSRITATKTETGYSFVFDNVSNDDELKYIVIEVGDIIDFIGKTITLSTSTSCTHPRQRIGYSNSDGTSRKSMNANTFTVTDQSQSGYTKIVIWLYAKYNSVSDWCDEYSNIQVEYGDTATAYEPYQNLYIPQNVQ